MTRKILCIEQQKENFDKIPMKELREMVGWIEPDKDGTWDVTLTDCYFECKSQEHAQIMASLEELKAIEMNKINNK